jgi:hypothetical protein
MIDPASNWFEIVNLPLDKHCPGISRKTQNKWAPIIRLKEAIGYKEADKSSIMISKLLTVVLVQLVSSLSTRCTILKQI